ncbi:MAG: 2Fe-2S iron-sulfur cluster binding domain-containing protein [Rhodospirillaceae bacterium]|nr:2Fe-2S iron-sulfur cluster binding domain-containing protein [Rhodospirillaceae bacterium]
MTHTIDRLRLGSGLVLLAFVTCHLLNHAAGIVSLEAQDWAREAHHAIWGEWPGLTVLLAATVVHVAIALRAIYVRRSLRLAPLEWGQLLLGLAIPFLLAEHVLGTTVSEASFGIEPSYAYVQAALWLVSPWPGIKQVTVLLVAWVHGTIGIYYWLRLKPWFHRAAPYLLAAAVLVPALSLAGIISTAIEVMALARQPGWIGALLRSVHFDPEAAEFVAEGELTAQIAFVVLVAGTVAARAVRQALVARSQRPMLRYPGGRKVPIQPGASVLEISRSEGIAHASVCGGRGRCSTCRVRVSAGAEHLPPPDTQETRVLARIGAPPDVRLACQIRPTRSLEVVPLLPASATAEAGFRRPAYLAGQERELAVMFTDLRGFTQLSDGRLPFDVVYLLNRYFAAMGGAVEQAGGRVDKFIGDGVMALFGLTDPPEEACRQALAAARTMGAALDMLNRDMANDLPAPLRMGIGIHAGPVIVGEMGHGLAKQLTAIGDTVNIASRLEGLCKTLGVAMVVSDHVAAVSGLPFDGFERRETEIRGRDAALAVRLVGDPRELPQV